MQLFNQSRTCFFSIHFVLSLQNTTFKCDAHWLKNWFYFFLHSSSFNDNIRLSVRCTCTLGLIDIFCSDGDGDSDCVSKCIPQLTSDKGISMLCIDWLEPPVCSILVDWPEYFRCESRDKKREFIFSFLDKWHGSSKEKFNLVEQYNNCGNKSPSK